MTFTESAARLAGLTGAVLGWRPDTFWAATPAELVAIFEAMAPAGEAPPTRNDLDRLKEQFPDG